MSGNRLSAERLGWLLLLVILVLSVLAYGPFLRNPFFGSDTWPWLESSGITSIGDAVRLAFSPIMPGTQFHDEVALFYHPLTSLSYAVNLALFGLNPASLYATNLVIHLVVVVALFTLARSLSLSPWAAALAALIQALHPIAAATVPSLPRRQDMVVAAMLLIAMSLLARARLFDARPRWVFVAASLAAYFLALGGKEIAYAGIAVVPFVIACAYRPGDRLKNAVLACFAFVGVEAFAFGVRWLVLGGLGGYYGSESVRGRLDGLIEFYLRPYVTDVLWPVHALMPSRLRDWLLALGAVILVLAACVATMRRRFVMVVLLGMVWQAAFLGLYVAVHTSLGAYLLYVPLVGLALMLAAMLDGAVDAVRDSQRATRRVASAIVAITVAIVSLGVLKESALLTPFPEWTDAGFVSDRYLSQAVPCFQAGNGRTVEVTGLPHAIDYPTEHSQFVDAFVFEPYSLDAAVAVLAPGTVVEFDVRDTVDLTARPSDVQVTCTPTERGTLVSSRIIS